MKKLSQFATIILLVASIISCDNNDEKDIKTETKSFSMGAGYANDIYFSLADGLVSTPNRTEWDIAFYTNARTSSILINDGKGLTLYPWKSIAEWESTDTTGLYMKPLYSNVYTGETWENGAFDQGAKGHPDYGWGVYNMTTHDIIGDSVYILKMADGAAKKIWIEKRQGTNNTFYFRYANIDGTELKIDSVACNDYLTKNMIHYSLDNQTEVDHQPESTKWDLVFTKYYINSMNYIVTGILTNNGVKVAKVTDVDITNNDYSNCTFVNTISAIGYSWKKTNPDYSFYIPENEIYFIKDQNDKVYKIVFKTFEGMSTGNLSFDITTY